MDQPGDLDVSHSRALTVLGLMAGSLAGLACDGARAGAPKATVATGLADTAPDTACSGAVARPATGAPAEGVWLYDGGGRRVAAVVGRAQAVAGAAHVTRRVETLEAAPGRDTIRFASDTAAVRLQFLPPAARPAAVYAVGPHVLLASYEPCGPALLQPLIRYLRQDPAGGVATDVMLQRESAAP